VKTEGSHKNLVKFQYFVAVRIHVEVFRIMTLCRLVGGYQRFEERRSVLKMEAVCSSERSVTADNSTWCQNQKTASRTAVACFRPTSSF
jgi:hypothetical protein